MTTILLLLAAVFIGYALYVAFTSKSGLFFGKAPDYMTHKSPGEQEEGAQANPEPQVIAAETEPAMAEDAKNEQPAAVKQPAEEKVPGAEETRITGFRNPETGETASKPSNYRFAKRWIKEAMVAEGLLDKVYKNSELKGPTDKKVKEALNSFKQMDKYYDE